MNWAISLGTFSFLQGWQIHEGHGRQHSEDELGQRDLAPALHHFNLIILVIGFSNYYYGNCS